MQPPWKWPWPYNAWSAALVGATTGAALVIGWFLFGGRPQ